MALKLPIAESELILNDRGAIYHLNLRPEELASTILVVGDPDRVAIVSKYFDKLEYKLHHREFITHTGYVGKKRVTVISTGIGTDNIDIVVNELDALVNIDFTTRTIRDNLHRLNIIRLGTCGSLQSEISVDDFVASTHGIGIDNLLNFYRHPQNEEEKQLLQSFVTQTQLHNRFSNPYIASASGSLMKLFVEGFKLGITVTCPGFYGPQGRILRLGLSNPDLVSRLTQFQYGQHRIANFEMETSALYGLSNLLGHHCLSLNAVVANRIRKDFSKNASATVERLIQRAIDIISTMG